MIIHTVREPFMSREGQFEKDRRSLCIGLDVATVESNKSFLCYLGKNKKTYYEIESVEALRLGHEYNSYWKNPKGKTVIILPLKDFKVNRSKWDKEKYEKKEIKRREIIQQKLI